MTRLLVCGSREWGVAVGGNEDKSRAEFNRLKIELNILHPDMIIHGGATGADTMAEVWWSCDEYAEMESYPVEHALDGPWPAAGPRRNARMLRVGRPDRGLAFGALWKPTSSTAPIPLRYRTGTGGMVSLMLAARLPVRWIAAPGVAAVDLTEMPAPGDELR